MSKTIGIIAIKGGVGKTTISSSLAADLVNHHGKKVLLVDANYSAPNLGLHMDIVSPEKTIHDVLSGRARLKSAIHNRYGVDVIPGSYSYSARINPMKLHDKLRTVKDDYDFIIIDSSPSLNDEILSAMISSDHLFVVTTPDYPTISCSVRAAKLALHRNKPIAGLIVNKIRDPKFEIPMEEIEGSLGIPIVAKIPDDINVARSLFTRIPATVYNRRSGFSREVGRLSSALTLKKEKLSLFRKILAPDFKREEVNRQLLRENFYRSVFSEK